MGKDTEYKFKYSRGSGPGGQHRNKVESCVTVTHVPTGLEERACESRSQLANKKLALARLETRISELAEEDKREEINKIRKESLSNGRVRTYNYKTGVVTDHRTGNKASLKKILEGELDLL